jgi:hypothetical protein
VAFVVSTNLHRRHLSPSQLGLISGRLANLQNGTNQHRVQSEGSKILLPNVTQAEAASLMNVSVGSVKHARSVIDHGIPELVREVEQDRVSVSAAAEIAKLPEQQHRAIVADGPKVVQAIARDMREHRAPKPDFARNPDLDGQSILPAFEQVAAEQPPAGPRPEVAGGSAAEPNPENSPSTCSPAAGSKPAGVFAGTGDNSGSKGR